MEDLSFDFLPKNVDSDPSLDPLKYDAPNPVNIEAPKNYENTSSTVQQEPVKEDSFSSMLKSTVDNAFADANEKQKQLPQKEYRTQFTNPNVNNQFAAQKIYNPQGFNPKDFVGNIQRYANAETMSTAAGKGFSDLWYKFKDAFGQYYGSYVDIGKSIAHMDYSYMKPSEDDMITRYYNDQKNEDKNFVFQSNEEENQFFNKRFVKDMIGNTGFTLGTMAGLGLELAADAVIETASFGAATPLVAGEAAIGITKATTTLGRLTKGFSVAGSKTAKEIEGLGLASQMTSTVSKSTRNAYSEMLRTMGMNLSDVVKSKSAFEAMKAVLNQVPLVGNTLRYGEKVLTGIKAGATGSELAGMTLQGFRRVMMELNASASEAGFEAVSTYGDTFNQMVQKYKLDHNGVEPNGEEMNRMRELSVTASGANYNTNMAILLITNRLQFGNLFGKFKPMTGAMRDVIDTMATDEAESLIKVTGKTGTKQYQRGFFGTYGQARQIAKDFGRKEALKQLGYQVARDTLRFEVSEGIQENLQDISAASWKNYYSNIYSKDPTDMFKELGSNTAQQFTSQGLKTFVMGAFTGRMIGIAPKLMQKGMSAIQEAPYTFGKDKTVKNPYEQHRKDFQSDLDLVNSFTYHGSTKVFNDKVFNFKAQQKADAQMTEAASKNLQYEFNNSKENALLSAVKAGRRTNSIDGLIQQMRMYGETFTNEQFKEAFGFDISDTEEGNVKMLSNKIADDLQKYNDRFDEVKRKMGPYLDPSIFKEDTLHWYTAVYHNQAREDAVELLALNAIKSDMAIERANKISQDLGEIPGIKHSSDYALRVLADPNKLTSELHTLQSEVNSLTKDIADTDDRSLKREMKERLNSKIDELELLVKWNSFWTNDPSRNSLVYTGVTTKVDDRQEMDEQPNYVDMHDLKHEDVLKVFTKIMNIKNKQGKIDTIIRTSDIRDGFDKVIDYLRLGQDSKDYLDHVDALTNPEYFKAVFIQMRNGQFRSNILNTLELKKDNLYHLMLEAKLTEEEANSVINKFYNSEAYKNIETVYLDKYSNFDRTKYVLSQYDILDQLIKTELTRLRPEELKEETKPEETPIEETPEEVKPTEPEVVIEKKKEPETSDDGSFYSDPGEVNVDLNEEGDTLEINSLPFDFEGELGIKVDEPFQTEAVTDKTSNVVDSVHETLEEKPVAHDKADELTISLNATRARLEFSKAYLKKHKVILPEEDMLLNFTELAQSAVDTYNQQNETNITLEEFAKTTNGRKILKTIRNQILNIEKQDGTIITKPEITSTTSDQLALFTVQPIENFIGVNLESLTSLNMQIEKKAYEKSQESIKFVGEDIPLKDEQVVDLLKDLGSCFKS